VPNAPAAATSVGKKRSFCKLFLDKLDIFWEGSMINMETEIFLRLLWKEEKP
jgi:hypothetical protein